MTCLNSRPRTPENCPVCGEGVPPRALACPECGADHRSGWKEDCVEGLDLPEAEFDYGTFVEKEFGTRATGIKTLWWITAVVLLGALAASLALAAF